MPIELTQVGSIDDAPERDDEPPADRSASRTRRLWRRAAITLGLPMLISAAVVTLLVLLCNTAYEINDDTTLNAIVNGDYTGTRSSSLVVAPAMFAHVMRAGYALLPNVPWYGITLYVLQAIGWAAIGVVAFTLRRRPALPERLVIIATMLVLAPWMILRISFTATSLLIGTAGLLVFVASAKVKGRVGTAYAVAAGVLLGSLFLIRTYSFLGIVVAFAPVLAFAVFKAGVRRTVVFALVIGAFALTGYTTNKIEYGRSAEWRRFMVTNAARSSLHATPRVSDKNVTRHDLDVIGWSQNDLKLFADFYYPDQRVYSQHAIRELAKLSPRVRDDTRTKHIFDKLRGPFTAIPFAVAVLLGFRRSRWVGLYVLVSAVWFVGVLAALILYVRLPNRVLIPLEGGGAFLAVIAPAYLTSLSRRAQTRSKHWNVAITAVVAVLLVGTAWTGIRLPMHISDDNANALRKRTRAYAALTAIDPKGIFLARGDFFGLNADPTSVHTPFQNPNFVALGWATNSPLFTERLKRLGITNVYASLARNPHVYLYATGIEVRRVALFYKQHRGPVTYEKVSPHTIFGYNVWSFRRAPVPVKPVPKKPVRARPPAKVATPLAGMTTTGH